MGEKGMCKRTREEARTTDFELPNMTGKNFAINAAPGLSREWRRAPPGATTKVKSNTPIPAKAEGNEIDRHLNS